MCGGKGLRTVCLWQLGMPRGEGHGAQVWCVVQTGRAVVRELHGPLVAIVLRT